MRGFAAAAAAEPRCGCALTYAALYSRQADDNNDEGEECVGRAWGGWEGFGPHSPPFPTSTVTCGCKCKE